MRHSFGNYLGESLHKKRVRRACEVGFLDERFPQIIVAHSLTEFHYLHQLKTAP